MFKAFYRNTDGGVAVIFSVSIVAVLCCVGAAVDYSRLNTTKVELNAAIDAAALAGAKFATTDIKAAQAAAEEAFKGNYRNFAARKSFSAELIKASPSDSFRVKATVEVPMSITRLMGYNTMPVGSSADVVVGSDVDLQIALALDTTGSMR
ncbi:MAG: hypothetical protein K2X62_11665 [Beijerinckiaceae bacterium]|nr:hypothetical protein [Beijerinckiaceae bacterium]